MMLAAYETFGGYTFGSTYSVFKALIAIYMIFVLGTVVHEYATGRTREFPMAFIVMRILVVLIIAGIIHTWIGYDL